MWYDEEWRSRVTDEPINGLLGNRQAYRRTMSVAHGMCPVPLTDPQSEDEMCRGVSSLYCYTCRESPVEMITCRPGTNEYFKAVLIIWRACWPRLKRVSRRSPFNAWQVMVYHPTQTHPWTCMALWCLQIMWFNDYNKACAHESICFILLNVPLLLSLISDLWIVTNHMKKNQDCCPILAIYLPIDILEYQH